jgi:hypothetical protein
LLGALPVGASAAITTFGSPLTGPATLNTSEGLGYLGTYTQVPPSPEAPTGVIHTSHFGADTALWNVSLPGASAAAPATGQAIQVKIEGCALAAAGGPAPLTQIHLQDLTPLPGGGAHVDLTSQPFDLPVCGEGGASGTTITTYEPTNLCVSAGDYVALNDEGGFVERYYRSGVPYLVIGSSSGAALDSFIRGGGTGDGAVIRSGDTTNMDGFVANADEELMLQVTLGTGPDATHICAGGTAGAPAVLAPLHIRPQTDGVNHSGFIAVAVYCRPASGCGGQATLGLAGKAASYTRASFSLPGSRTGHVQLHISPALMRQIRRHHGVSAQLTLTMGGQTFSQPITIKIL